MAVHRFNAGEFECAVIADGGGPRDISSMFNGVTPDEVAKALQPHNLRADAVDFSINILFINTGRHRVLVDTGLGDPANPGVSQLPATLRAEGINPAQIDTLIITHAHADHINAIHDETGKLNFPNAQHLISRTEWDYWLDDSTAREAEASHRASVRRNLVPLKDSIRLFDGEPEIVPGIHLLTAPGHTLGQTAVAIVSGDTMLLQMADAAHHPIQLEHPDWSPQFDMQPDVSAQTRRKLFSRAATTNALLMAYHFPFPGLVRAHAEGGCVGVD